MRIIYTDANTLKTCVVIPTSKELVEKDLNKSLTDQEYKDHILAVSVPPNALDVKEVTAVDIPSDRTFRNAWKINNGAIEHDMTIARELHMNELRRLRQEQFKKLGFADRMNPVVEEAVVPLEIRNQLNQLRDMPQTFDLSSVSDIETLKNMKPSYLEGIPHQK